MTYGTLYLLPVPLGEGAIDCVLPAAVLRRARKLEHFVVEDAKRARAHLKRFGVEKPLQQLHLAELNAHTQDSAIPGLAQVLLSGQDLGLMSEAGCPAVADPGAKLVRHAHRMGIRVVPLVGPSSILLALMASGLNGQSFVFHGYLPVAEADRLKALRALERESRRAQQTQIFIETPYRNDKLMDSLCSCCAPDTLLCIATDLTLESEDVRTQSVAAWKQNRPRLDRRPSLFLLLAA